MTQEPEAWKEALSFLTVAGLLAYFYPLSLGDTAFAVLYPAYLHATQVFRFGRSFRSKYKTLGKDQFRGTSGFRLYMMVFQVVTVLAPLLLLLLTPISMRHKQVAATPLILLLVQVAMERVPSKWHDVTRIMVPIGFNAYRLLSLWTWIRVAYDDCVGNTNHHSVTSQVCFTVALMNGILWTYNLFIFLLWRVLPLYFDKEDSPDVPRLTWKANLFPVAEKEETEHRTR